MMSNTSSLMHRLGLAGFLFAAVQSAAFAHATLEQAQTKAGQSYKAVIKIGHGCDKTATTQVRVIIPEGVIAVKPMPKAGWTLATQTAPYGKSYDYFSTKLSEGVREISWSGGALPDGFYDEFVFQAYVAKDVAAGTRLYFPVVQICEKGRHDWVEQASAQQDPHALKAPAPFVEVLATNDAAPAAVKAGTMVIEAARTRVTPQGAPVAGGYLSIKNTGSEPDRLVSASIEIADVTEIHEMTNKDGVMIMRSLPDGLVIKPGETVELKPGSLHLMFIKPKRSMVEGEVLKGRLVFEKAGSVSVEFNVEPLGGTRPAAGGSGHSGHSGHAH